MLRICSQGHGPKRQSNLNKQMQLLTKEGSKITLTPYLPHSLLLSILCMWLRMTPRELPQNLQGVDATQGRYGQLDKISHRFYHISSLLRNSCSSGSTIQPFLKGLGLRNCKTIGEPQWPPKEDCSASARTALTWSLALNYPALFRKRLGVLLSQDYF